jgi:hypothetical protein
MPDDLEPLPARVLLAAPAVGPAAVAAEMLGRVRAELPAVGGLGERDQVLVAARLTVLRSARTRRSHAVMWRPRSAGRAEACGPRRGRRSEYLQASGFTAS